FLFGVYALSPVPVFSCKKQQPRGVGESVECVSPRRAQRSYSYTLPQQTRSIFLDVHFINPTPVHCGVGKVYNGGPCYVMCRYRSRVRRSGPCRLLAPPKGVELMMSRAVESRLCVPIPRHTPCPFVVS